MKDLQIFQNSEFGEIGILTVDGEVYFPVATCAEILGYSNLKRAIRDHCKGVTKTFTPSSERVQDIYFIPKSDLYRLISSSKSPASERFERWIFEEVLPSIRKHDGYQMQPNQPDNIAIFSQLVQMTSMMGEILSRLTGFTQGANVTTNVNLAPPAPAPVRKRPRRSHGTIAMLDDNLRAEVDVMLHDGRHTFQEIADFLLEQGTEISTSSVWRYHQREEKERATRNSHSTRL